MVPFTLYRRARCCHGVCVMWCRHDYQVLTTLVRCHPLFIDTPAALTDLLARINEALSECSSGAKRARLALLLRIVQVGARDGCQSVCLPFSAAPGLVRVLLSVVTLCGGCCVHQHRQALSVSNVDHLNVIGHFLGDVLLCVKEASKRTRYAA